MRQLVAALKVLGDLGHPSEVKSEKYVKVLSKETKLAICFGGRSFRGLPLYCTLRHHPGALYRGGGGKKGVSDKGPNLVQR